MRLALALLVLLASPQDKKKAPAHPGVDQAKVDEAIKKGVEFLKAGPSPVAYANEPEKTCPDSDGLILYTLIHAGVAADDPKVQALIASLLAAKLERTYPVALQAMCLEELNRVKYQPRIQQCAQFLVDNQCRNGQWSYGEPTAAVPPTFTPGGGADVPTGGVREYKTFSKPEKPKVEKKLAVKKTRDGPEKGDNSNSQYAALGLRACHDAGITIPKPVIQLAVQWWRGAAIADKGPDNGYGGVRGWGYYGNDDDPAYGTMGAGAVASLLIYDSILDIDWKKDLYVKAGLGWLAVHYSVEANPGRDAKKHWYYYYMYALERVGVLYGTETLGRHDWYPEGAKVLLERQKPDGSWDVAEKRVTPQWDTCFAILFLRRATRPLQDVATEAAGTKK